MTGYLAFLCVLIAPALIGAFVVVAIARIDPNDGSDD